MTERDVSDGAAARYSPTTIDHFQHPRNVGRIEHPTGVGRVDDRATETTIAIYVLAAGRSIARATFRTFGCSACVAASSMATELLLGRTLEDAADVSAEAIERELGGLPPAKRYCAELVSRAVAAAIEQALEARA